VVLSGFLIVLVWFFLIPPSNDRDWQKDVAVLARARIDGDRVTIENVRNNEYRTETDFTPRYDTRTYDLKALRSLDLYLVYWGSPLIAHTILSFVFDGDRYLAISIETRKNGDEAYSAVQGSCERICPSRSSAPGATSTTVPGRRSVTRTSPGGSARECRPASARAVVPQRSLMRN
jgi:Domain of unknown function (DUF4105)